MRSMSALQLWALRDVLGMPETKFGCSRVGDGAVTRSRRLAAATAEVVTHSRASTTITLANALSIFEL
jgi:hypothetical protein